MGAGPQCFNRLSLGWRPPANQRGRVGENDTRRALCCRHTGIGGAALANSLAADRVRAGFRSGQTRLRLESRTAGRQHYRVYQFRTRHRRQMARTDQRYPPGAMRVLVVFEPDNAAQLAYLQAIEAAAPTFRVELIRAGVRNAAEIERAIDAFAQEPKGALIIVPSALGIAHRDLIVALAARHHLPAIYPYPVFARSGGFISYRLSLADL